MLLNNRVTYETNHLRDTVVILSDKNKKLRGKLGNVTREKRA